MELKKSNEKRENNEQHKNQEFKVGDLAVYPAHGVGEIRAIETKIVDGKENDFYILKVLEKSMVIMIPICNVKSVGLRNVISKKEIPKVYEVIKKDRELLIDKQTWNRRYKEYMDKLKTGSLYDVAEVFRDLYFLKITKDLSFGERKLFDTATALLLGELSTATNTDEETIMSELKSLVSVPNEN